MPSGSKPISGFSDGSPSQAADDFVFERLGVTFRIPYSTLKAALIAAIGQVNFNPSAQIVLGDDGIDGEDGIPGIKGVNGISGVNGIPGAALFILPDSPDDPDEPILVRGLTGATGSTSDPFQGVFATGSFTIPTGKYAVMSKQLILTGAQQVILQGTARLRIT
jgi:hypothetical protein